MAMVLCNVTTQKLARLMELFESKNLLLITNVELSLFLVAVLLYLKARA